MLALELSSSGKGLWIVHAHLFWTYIENIMAAGSPATWTDIKQLLNIKSQECCLLECCHSTAVAMLC